MASAFTIIRNGLLVNPRRRPSVSADILVDGDTILTVGAPGMDAPEDAVLMDASDRAMMPGMVNGHVHGHGTLAKGLVGDRWPLELFLNAMPGMAGSRSLEDKYLNGLVAAVEMIRKGCTACYDLFFEFPLPSRDGVIALGQAYRDAGVRAVIAPMVADKTLYQAYPGLIDAVPEQLRGDVLAFKLAPYQASADAAEAIYADWPFDRDWIRPAIAPTIPLHCSDEFLVRCRDLASAYELPLQTHLAETKAQAVVGLRKYGKTLTAHLDFLGMLGPHLSAAHAIWLDGDDLGRLADNGASVVHAPVSNMRFGSGLAHLRPMLDRGINVGVATDAANSSDQLNMFEATRLAALISRVQTPDFESWLGADEVLRMATIGSARAMGLGGAIGEIAPGFKADIVFLDLANINYVPCHDVVSQIVFTENGAAVDSVMIGGRMVLDHGRLTTIDEKKLRRDASAAAERLFTANAPMRSFAKQLHGFVGQFCHRLACEPYHVHRLASPHDL
ncbi:MAG: amidohydrolase family protein [Xanthobacteraceae bacterium]|jgi:5-methylthioadenosine/S-adenosylhomocysteine deaminase